MARGVNGSIDGSGSAQTGRSEVKKSFLKHLPSDKKSPWHHGIEWNDRLLGLKASRPSRPKGSGFPPTHKSPASTFGSDPRSGVIWTKGNKPASALAEHCRKLPPGGARVDGPDCKYRLMVAQCSDFVELLACLMC